MKELLDKVITLYENSYVLNGVCVYVNSNVCNVDKPSIWINGDTLYFEFEDDDIDDFKVLISEIVSIKFDTIGDKVLSIIELESGNTILIFNM